MPNSATLNHAARVLASLSGDVPGDAALRRYLLGAPRLDPQTKRAVSRAVFAYFRWLQWLDPRDSLQSSVDDAIQLQARFDADENSIKTEALGARAVPRWLKDEMELPPGYLRQLQREPALWIRAQLGTERRLATELRDCVPAAPESGADFAPLDWTAFGSPAPSSPVSGSDRGVGPVEPSRKATARAAAATVPGALRYNGTRDLFLEPAFHRGAFEIQDLASQLVGHACSPRPGETWWDACAGEGGKLLHLADLMENRGVIWATDRSERRLRALKRRAARAQVFNYRAASWDGSERLPTRTRFDGILVDAPCSGVGTWQRNPHARWTTTREDVRELAEVQLALLNNALPALKPHGRIFYSACTLTRTETVEVVNAFTAAHPELSLLPMPVFRSVSPVALWPQQFDANGMFIAAWRLR